MESVLLPFKTTPNLPEDAEVLWRRFEPERSMKVHVYQDGSDGPEGQDQLYRDRTKMHEDSLRTGDLSLTLNQPTEEDSGEYRCEVISKKVEIRRETTVKLKVSGECGAADRKELWSVCLSACLSVRLSSVCLQSVCLSVFSPSVCPSVCLSVFSPPVCLSV